MSTAGYSMLALLFIAVFYVVAVKDSFEDAVLAFSFTAAIIGWVYLAVWMIG